MTADHGVAGIGGADPVARPLFLGVVRRNDAADLQLDRVDRIAAGDEQRAAIGTTERLVRRADLPLRLAPIDRQVDRAEEFARWRRDADDAGARSAARVDVA